MERDGKPPCITVMQGRSTTVLEMEHPVVDFITICESPWSSGESKMKTKIFFLNLMLNSVLLLNFYHRYARSICNCCFIAK